MIRHQLEFVAEYDIAGAKRGTWRIETYVPGALCGVPILLITGPPIDLVPDRSV